MRTLFVPAATSWSFPPQSPPVSWIISPGSDSGVLYLQAVTTGSCPVDGEGIIFTVIIDGGAPYVSACMENGVDTVIIPPGTTSISVTTATGCNAGPDPTSGTVWAVSDP